MNTIPTSEAISILEDAHRLSLNSKGHPRSMALVRYLDVKILELKALQRELEIQAKQREQQRPPIWKSLISWAHVGRDVDAPSFFKRNVNR